MFFQRNFLEIKASHITYMNYNNTMNSISGEPKDGADISPA